MALLGEGIWVPPRLWHASTIRCNYYWYSSSSLSVPALLSSSRSQSESKVAGMKVIYPSNFNIFPIELLFETGQNPY
jgi:hypothetical protein